jgi:hypothetical protein
MFTAIMLLILAGCAFCIWAGVGEQSVEAQAINEAFRFSADCAAERERLRMRELGQ